MADRYRINDPDQISQREPEDEDAIADGDASLDSEPPNVTEAEPAPGTDEDGEDDDDDDDDRLDSDDGTLESLRRELSAVTDRQLRLAAEFDNYRKRVERERAETWTRAQADLAARILDPLDDLHRVSEHAATSTAESLLQGVQLVERKLRQALAAAGLEDVDAEGAPFDPNSMEAVAMVGTDSQVDDDVVSDVFQRGYTFKGSLLRPARVRVKKHGI
jgi:molecular chaperone GrpE